MIGIGEEDLICSDSHHICEVIEWASNDGKTRKGTVKYVSKDYVLNRGTFERSKNSDELLALIILRKYLKKNGMIKIHHKA